MGLKEESVRSVCDVHFPEVKLKTGASVIKIDPVFTYDSKYLLVGSGSDVKVFSIASGECIFVFQMHKNAISSLQLNQRNSLQVLSCSEDGIVMCWDYSDGKVLKLYNLGISRVVAFYAPFIEKPWFVMTFPDGKETHRLYSLTMRSGKVISKTSVLKSILPKKNAIAFGTECSFIAGICGNNLLLYNCKKKSSRRHKTGERELTCVACHPIEYIVATGDKDGRILVWADMLESNHPSYSIYHWHTLPVSDLIFSVDGSHIYSCGGESALVKWNLISNTKQIIPRLGLPICSISVSSENMYLATAHEDNVIQIINAHNKVVQVIQGLTLTHQRNKRDAILPSGMIFDPRSLSVVMNGKPGHLQFYKMKEDRQVYSVDIVCQNIISQERNSEVINTDIEKAAIDDKGQWLATVENRDDGETSIEIRLKFWFFKNETQRFVLNTNIFLPHNKKVNCLKFRPQHDNLNKFQLLAVTTSDDCRFKIWVLNHHGSDEKASWSCSSMGYYRDYCALCASFSDDGSVLAVAFQNIATLWSPDTNNLKAALRHSSVKSNIKNIAFGQDQSVHLLVCCYENVITVWNILTLSVLWSVNCSVQCLVANPLSDTMVAFANEGYIFIFEPTDPKPLRILKSINSEPVISAIFVPHWSRKQVKSQNPCCWQQYSKLYFLNQKQELLTVTDKSNDNLQCMPKQVISPKHLPVTPYGLIKAEQSVTDLIVSQAEVQSLNKSSVVEKIKCTDISCPTIQDPLSLAVTFLKSTLVPLQQIEKKNYTCEDESEKCIMDKDLNLDEKQKYFQNCQSVMNLCLSSCDKLEDYSFLLHFPDT